MSIDPQAAQQATINALAARIAELERAQARRQARMLASNVGSGAQTGFGSSAGELLGCAVAWTANPARKYRTIVHLPRVDQATAAGFVYLSIWNATTAITNGSLIRLDAGSSGFLINEVIETGLSGAQTRIGRLRTTSGSASTIAGYLPTISVEDVGPA